MENEIPTTRQSVEESTTLEGVSDRRKPGDRRKLTWKTVVEGFLHPRRREARREEPDGYYVDYYDAKLWIPVGGILVFAVMDAMLALRLLPLGGEESSRLAADLLSGRDLYLAGAKLVGTAVGVLCLTALANFRILRLIRVRTLLYVIFVGYAAFIAYELAFLLG